MQQRWGAGANEVAPAVGDLIAGLTKVDELPPAASRHADTNKSPVWVVTVPLATDGGRSRRPSR